jgi:uncharacterized protein (DUF342 family)
MGEKGPVLRLEVSKDRMSATLAIPAGYCIEPVNLKAQIQACGICFGLVGEGVMAAQQKAEEDRDIVIARGQPAEHGLDGSIQMLVQTEPKMVIKPDGTIDFKELTIEREAVKGQRLAVYTPATLGNFGLTIRGERLDPRPGKNLELNNLCGIGTLIPPQDRKVLFAARDGVIAKAKDGRLSIVDQFIVEGDIDLRVGNVDTKHPVIIKGDIRKGFKVKSEGDITVEGVIEDARVSAGGNLIVAGGILPGVERVKARGELQARFIHNRVIKARSMNVVKGIRHSDVQCRKDVHAGNIFGGHLCCGGSLYVNDLGTEHGDGTFVRVGFDPYVYALAEAEKTGEEVHLDAATVANVGKNQAELEAELAASDSDDEADDDSKADHTAREVPDDQRDPPPGTRLEVTGALHPPMEIWFGGAHKWQTVIPARNVTMMLVEEEIRVLPGLLSAKLSSGKVKIPKKSSK